MFTVRIKTIDDYDGIFPSKPRNDGIHLGGTIKQEWSWTEIIY
jgi:hypothetical protein